MQATLADDIDSSMQAAAQLPTCTVQAEFPGDSDRHDSKKTTYVGSIPMLSRLITSAFDLADGLVPLCT
jgi:hypothetical protein